MVVDRRRLIFLVSLTVVLVIFGGSVVYWLADGAVGTPEEFRDRVASIGLEVDWVSVGPRAGDGRVETDCGTVSVTVNEIDGDLWLTANGERHQITSSTVDDLLSCRSQ
ncbi:MAG: hypothetical protein JJE47_14540 [Acidimicrobiia bacterium]|nr:hypothetical protein [Acidimicrobiia bacterium]